MEKNTPLAFDTIEILNNNNILCIIWGARNKLDKSLWSIFPRSLTWTNWEEIYSSFSQSDSNLGKNWRKVQFFLDLLDWGECSISSSCWGDGGEERFLWPGDNRDRSNMSWGRKFYDTEKTSSSQPANWEAQLELCEGWRDSACQGLLPHPGGSFNSMLTLEQMDILYIQ